MANLISQVKKLPDVPGVYIFKDGRGKILYIGKATSLRDRVKSYFANDLLETRGELLVKMVELAKKIDFETTDSVLEALIREAYLIKKHQPYHNTKEKDNRSYNHVVFTNELFPRVLVVRGREVEQTYTDPSTYTALYGPFPDGSSLRIAMKIIRRVFPYRDNCVLMIEQKSGQKTATGRPCFNYQIGLCPGPCAGAVTPEEYGKTIKHLMMFFEGRKKALLSMLEKEMKAHAKAHEFEKAEKIKRTVFALQHIHDIALIRKDKNPEQAQGQDRIEAYDISHFSGQSTVGVMTVIEHGDPVPAEYRMFKIRSTAGNDDLGSLEEVLRRRFTHTEWSFPALVVIDGGQTHLNRAQEVLNSLKVTANVVSVVKDERHQPRDVLASTDTATQLAASRRREILLANSEAHRFAIKYHQKIRNRVQ